MSYNSSKGPINIGDLINEDDPDTLIDWESDKIVFKTNSTKRFVIDNNEISGSGAAVIVGNTVLGGTLKVSGSTTLAGPSTLGNDASDVTTLTGQVTASAGVLLSSTLDVGGNTTLGNAVSDTVSITGKTTVTGNLSASLGITGSLLLSTGSTAQVAVGVKSPVATNMLYVSTIDNDNRVALYLTDTAENTLLAVSGSGKVVVGGKGAPYIDGRLNVTGSGNEKLITVKSDTQNPAFYISGSGDLYASGKIGIGTISPAIPLDVNGNAIRIRTASTPSSAGDFGVAGEIRWDANYIYVCIATDTWKRVAISTW